MDESLKNTRDILYYFIDFVIPILLILFTILVCSGVFKWLGNKTSKAHDWYLRTAVKIEQSVTKVCTILDKLWVKILTGVLTAVYIVIIYIW